MPFLDLLVSPNFLIADGKFVMRAYFRKKTNSLLFLAVETNIPDYKRSVSRALRTVTSFFVTGEQNTIT